MRSPRSVKRRHTNHHATNTRRNRGKLIKNARMRRKQWAYTLIYSSDTTPKKSMLNYDTVVILKEVTDEGKIRRAEKKKEKKLLSKNIVDENRRLERQRKVKEREERRIKKDGVISREIEQEYKKMQEMLKKKKIKIDQESRGTTPAEKKTPEENTKKVVNKEKENTRKKIGEKESIVRSVAPAVEKKNDKNVRKSVDEKHPDIRRDDLMSTMNANRDMELYEMEKQAMKKSGKTKKTSETDSGFHNDDHDVVVINEVSEISNNKSIANGSVVQSAFDEFMFDTTQRRIPNGDSVREGDEKNNSSKLGENQSDSHRSADVKEKPFKAQESDVNKSPMSIQINEVTTNAHIEGIKGNNLTSSTSPTQLAQNVEKLVAHVSTKMERSIGDNGPSVKTTISAQMPMLSVKKPEASTDHKTRISPLPLDHHFSRPTTPSNRERIYKLLPKDIIYCSGLIDAHKDNYAAMAADPRNVFKEDVRAIGRKIRIFKESPYYQMYLRAKEEGRSIEDVLAESGEI